jgi:hypothetical protein
MRNTRNIREMRPCRTFTFRTYSVSFHTSLYPRKDAAKLVSGCLLEISPTLPPPLQVKFFLVFLLIPLSHRSDDWYDRDGHLRASCGAVGTYHSFTDHITTLRDTYRSKSSTTSRRTTTTARRPHASPTADGLLQTHRKASPSQRR